MKWLGSLFHVGRLLSDLLRLFRVVCRYLVARRTPSPYLGIATSLQPALTYHKLLPLTAKVSVQLSLMLTMRLFIMGLA
jgi:hypothetical protein